MLTSLKILGIKVALRLCWWMGDELHEKWESDVKAHDAKVKK